MPWNAKYIDHKQFVCGYVSQFLIRNKIDHKQKWKTMSRSLKQGNNVKAHWHWSEKD